MGFSSVPCGLGVLLGITSIAYLTLHDQNTLFRVRTEHKRMRAPLFNNLRTGQTGVSPWHRSNGHRTPTPGPPQGSQRGQRSPPEGAAVRRPFGPEADDVLRASRWRGCLEEAVEEDDEDRTLVFNAQSTMTVISGRRRRRSLVSSRGCE